MKKKILISLLVIILLCGIGYFVYSKYIKDNNPIEENKSSIYNDVKKVNIDAKDYTIGLKKYGKNYQFDKIPSEGTGAIELYLNDKKIKTITYKIDSVDPGDVVIKIDPYKFSDKYILVSITYSDGIKICYNDFYIFNLSGEFIGETTWNGSFGIKEVSSSKVLTYEINDDSLIIYSGNPVTKVSYTIVNNEFTKKTLKTYSNDEVIIYNK